MLFRRRKPAGLMEKLRGVFWPRKGFRRPFRYYGMRILRLTASPHAIAAGLAAGVVSSWTPFIGFHIVLALILAYALAGNMLAAALGTAFGNPLTFPFIWASTWEIGNYVLGTHATGGGERVNLARLFEKLDLSQLWGPILKPMVVGAVPLAVITGPLIYIVTFYAVRGFQRRRRARLAARAGLRLGQPLDSSASV
ncbi:MAG: DUF2062 domain-containing protein [Allorhizobium sp.]